jgi:hypothetical protein
MVDAWQPRVGIDSKCTAHIQSDGTVPEQEERTMRRLLCSALLAGGLMLVGLDVYESRQVHAAGVPTQPAAGMREDGTPLPPPPPPPPAR